MRDFSRVVLGLAVLLVIVFFMAVFAINSINHVKQDVANLTKMDGQYSANITAWEQGTSNILRQQVEGYKTVTDQLRAELSSINATIAGDDTWYNALSQQVNEMSTDLAGLHQNITSLLNMVNSKADIAQINDLNNLVVDMSYKTNALVNSLSALYVRLGYAPPNTSNVTGSH